MNYDNLDLENMEILTEVGMIGEFEYQTKKKKKKNEDKTNEEE